MLEVRFTDPTAPMLQIKPGSILALYGPSGAGKTTLARAIAGVPARNNPTAGIHLNGRNIRPLAAHRRRVGLVAQNRHLFPHLTVVGNLDFGLCATLQGEREALIDALDLGYLFDRLPSTLSGGETARVALGRALLARPEALILDEPFAGLDHARRAQTMDALIAYQNRHNIPMILITHEPQELATLCDTVALMADGRIHAIGPTHATPLRDAADISAPTLSIVQAHVHAHLTHDHLSELHIGGQPLFVARLPSSIGARVHVRIAASDIALSKSRVNHASILNQLDCEVIGIEQIDATGIALVDLAPTPASRLQARVTTRGLEQLDCQVGDNVFALIKSVAISPQFTPPSA